MTLNESYLLEEIYRESYSSVMGCTSDYARVALNASIDCVTETNAYKIM